MRQLLKFMNYAAQLMALIDIKGEQANSIIGLVCFFFFCLMGKVVFDSWEKNGINEQYKERQHFNTGINGFFRFKNRRIPHTRVSMRDIFLILLWV